MKRARAAGGGGSRRGQRGVSLVELMVALVLGLIVTGAALSLVLANRRTYEATERLGRLQENGSVAFELMARDVREAAGNPCDGVVDLVNVLKNPASAWYLDFADGLHGYTGAQAFADAAFGTAPGARVAGTDALELKSAVDGVAIVKHNPPSAQFQVSTKAHDLHPGDIALACDFNHAAVFQVTNAQPGTNDTIVHNTGTTVTPGNCTSGLGSPRDCSKPTGTAYEFGCRFGGQDPTIDCKLAANRWTALIARVRASRWYIGHNARGGTSLYQSRLRNVGGKLQVDLDEVADGVQDMDLSYLERGADTYRTADAVGDWRNVVAVRIALVLAATADGQPLRRPLGHVVAIRNRVP